MAGSLFVNPLLPGVVGCRSSLDPVARALGCSHIHFSSFQPASLWLSPGQGGSYSCEGGNHICSECSLCRIRVGGSRRLFLGSSCSRQRLRLVHAAGVTSSAAAPTHVIVQAVENSGSGRPAGQPLAISTSATDVPPKPKRAASTRRKAPAGTGVATPSAADAQQAAPPKVKVTRRRKPVEKALPLPSAEAGEPGAGAGTGAEAEQGGMEAGADEQQLPKSFTLSDLNLIRQQLEQKASRSAMLSALSPPSPSSSPSSADGDAVAGGEGAPFDYEGGASNAEALERFTKQRARGQLLLQGRGLGGRPAAAAPAGAGAAAEPGPGAGPAGAGAGPAGATGAGETGEAGAGTGTGAGAGAPAELAKPISYAVDPTTLKAEEYVVHKKYGIGRFKVMKPEWVEAKQRHVMYVYIKYADEVAKLPASQASQLLYRYRQPGEKGKAPGLSKLKDTTAWEARKKKGQAAIQKMVTDMMELYVHRLRQARPLYPRFPEEMAVFAQGFAYKPTPDQQKAFDDVEHDMTAVATPMDRLICGDVGFGKTEVALRAVYHAVLAGRQVMVLAPTTVLAKQHFKVLQERFAPFPHISVALLSRFQKETEKNKVVEDIKRGTVQVVAGTHALLGPTVRYHNLGLLVVDEEQRFGVRQKERITSLKTSVDVLTLSATPIPRTLSMALNGFRDASLIQTPPPERRQIQTHLLEWNFEQACKAIEAEVARGGQLFYVVPRVHGIEHIRTRLETQFPELVIGVAHGQLSTEVLEDAMEEFVRGRTHVLICTSIVESGLDISSVNTIIMEDVHLFGLSQLYQLRGRVGRTNKEAHAYMFHPPFDSLSDDAVERLAALEQCCGLGQGFQLAERDMAIRGVGNLFGEKQSGDAVKVGMDLYMEMLQDSLTKVEKQKLPLVEYRHVELDYDVELGIPADYIRDAEERAQVIARLERAATANLKALLDTTTTLRKTYGPEPAAMETYLKAMYLRRIAANLGIHRVDLPGERTAVFHTEMDEAVFETLTEHMKDEHMRDALTFKAGGRIELQGLIGLSPGRWLDRAFSCLADMHSGLPSYITYV